MNANIFTCPNRNIIEYFYLISIFKYICASFPIVIAINNNYVGWIYQGWMMKTLQVCMIFFKVLVLSHDKFMMVSIDKHHEY